MNIEDLEEALEEILPAGSFSVETNSKGRVVIVTNLIQDDDGELVDADDDDDDEEDPDFDPDFEPLEDEDEDEE